MSSIPQRRFGVKPIAWVAVCVTALTVVLGFLFGMRSVSGPATLKEPLRENNSKAGKEARPTLIPTLEPAAPQSTQIATAGETAQPSIHERIRSLADKINAEAIKIRDAHPEDGSFYIYQRDLRISTSHELSALVDSDPERWEEHGKDFGVTESFGNETLGTLLVIELSRSSLSLGDTTVGALVTDLLKNTDYLALSRERFANTLELAGMRDAASRVRSSVTLSDLYDATQANRNTLLARVDQNYHQSGLPGEWRTTMDRRITSAALTEAWSMYSISWRQREEEMKDELKRLMIERAKGRTPR